MLKHTQSQKHVFLIPDKGERTAVGNSLYILSDDIGYLKQL